MSYNSNIPQGTDPMIKSQGQIRANYQAINRVFSENHVQMNNDLFKGMHEIVNFRAQLDPTTSATQIALFTKLVTGQIQLFYAPSSSQTPIQLTNSTLLTGLQSTNPDIYLPEQYSFIPGPFIIYGGKIIGATNTQVKVLSPSSTLLYAGVITIFKTAAGNPQSFTTGLVGSAFTINLNPPATPQDLYYFAIGKP